MNQLTEQINREIARVMKQITAAAERMDLSAIEQQTKKASELRSMKDQVVAIEHRLTSLGDGIGAEITHQQTPGTGRAMAIEVTQGMINQNLLTLTEQIKRGTIRVGEKLTIEALPSGDRFETELIASGNKLQERGKIGKFYKDSDVRAGDIVLLSEITPGRWQLKNRRG